MEPVFFASPEDFRAWLEQHHAATDEHGSGVDLDPSARRVEVDDPVVEPRQQSAQNPAG